METFKDNQNQEWRLELDLTAARKNRAESGLDLFNPGHYSLLMQSLTERVGYVVGLIGPQMLRCKVGPAEFEKRLYGDGISDGLSDALLKEVASFFRSLGQHAMAKLTESHLATMQKTRKEIDRLIENGSIDFALENQTNALMKQLLGTLGDGSLNLQPSQRLIPGRGRSGNWSQRLTASGFFNTTCSPRSKHGSSMSIVHRKRNQFVHAN